MARYTVYAMLTIHPVYSLNIEYVFRIIYDAIFHSHTSLGAARSFIVTAWQVVTIVGILVALVALAVLIYSILQIFDVRRRELELFGPFPVLVGDIPKENPRWRHIQDMAESVQENDWRQSIIEADIMLGEMLTRQGYVGTSIGEQLKQIEPADFNTLNDAWEAHKVRNEIAHTGSEFVLSDTLARRVIAQYGNVFREFELV